MRQVAVLLPPLGSLAAAAGVILGVIFVVAAPHRIEDDREPAPPTEQIPVSSATIVPAPGLSNEDLRVKDMDEITRRPLFQEGRRQPVTPDPIPTEINTPDHRDASEEVDQERSPGPPPQVALRGFLEDAAGPRALLYDPVAATETWHGVGEVIGGWTLRSISETDVVVESEGEQFTIKLYE